MNNDDRSGANRTFYGPQTQHEVHHEPDNFPPTRPSTPIDFVYPSQYGRTGVNQRLPRYSLQDPSPYERARGEQLPSFIKLDERFDAVPGWITVIANIPAFQKAVLAAPGEDDAGPNQHHNNEWWRGQLIDANIIQPLDQFGQPENAPDSTRNIIPELRRLTAFLRSSHRAYANPIPLVQYCAIPSQHSNGIIGQVISHVVVAANDRADLDVSAMLVTTAGDGDSLRPIHHFTILSHDRHFEDFYRSLDFNFFELHSAISFDSLAPIVTLDVENDDVNGIPVGIEPPLVLHLDRYLRANQEVMGQVLQTRAEAEKDIVALQTRLKKKNPSGDLVDARKFLATTKDWLQQHLKVLTTSNDFWGELDIVNSDELKVETVDVTTIERLESAIEVELGLLDERERGKNGDNHLADVEAGY